MSFPKAKNKRFNEIMSCAPPVGSYDPKTLEKAPAALLDSKDERFKEPRPVDSHTSSLVNASVASTYSFQASTPKKLSAASSTESLASDRCVSGIPKRATSSSNIMAPVELAKQKDLERQIRLLVHERNELHRRVALKEEELQKVDSRLQQALKDRTSMMAELAAMEKELADLRKGNEILKTKVQEFNVDRLRQLQTEVTHLQDKLKHKEKEVTDMRDKLKAETEEKNSAFSALTRTNSKLADTNKELMKEIENKSRQLQLLVGNGSAYEAEMDLLKKDLSQLKSRNQKFVEEEPTLVTQCDRVQLVFSHCLNLQKQMENLVESITQQAIDSSTNTSDEFRAQLKSDISLLRTSLDSCHAQKMDAENVTGDLKLRVHELIDAAVTDVSVIESVHLDLLSLFSKLMKCQQNEEVLGQSVSVLNEKIKEHQDNLSIVTENKKELQKLYEEAMESVKTEKERFEKIQLTVDGLLSERTSVETELRNEQKLSISLQEKLRDTEAKISQLSEVILSMEKLICCSTGDKDDLLQQNLKLERELKNATDEQDRLENELKQFGELNEVIQVKDTTCKQLEEERNELATKLKAAEAEREMGQLAVEESCEKLTSLQLRYKLIESQLSEVNEKAKADGEKLVEELNEAKHLVSCQQNRLGECEAKMAEFESQTRCLETRLNDCVVDKDQLQHLKDQLELRLDECQAMMHSLEESSQQLSAELGEAREQVQKLEEERDRMLLEMKTCEEAEAVTAAELTQAMKDLEELKERAAMTKGQLDEVLSERDHLTEENRMMRTDLEEECNQSAGYEEQLTKHKQESEQLKEQLSMDAEKISSLEKAQQLLQDEMDKKCKNLEDTLDMLSQRKAELEYSVKTLETELSRSQDSLSTAEQCFNESESNYLLLSRELESVKAEQEEAENLVSRLQGEVQTVRLQMEQAEFARTELEVAKAYMEKDLSEVNDKLKDTLEEMEKVQCRSDEMEARNKQLSEDNMKSLAKIQGLEEMIEQLNYFLVEAKNAAAGKEEALQRSQEEKNDLGQQLEQQRAEICELEQLHCKSEAEIHTLTLQVNNSTSTLETKTTELQAATKEMKVLLTKVNQAEETRIGFEAEHARQTVECQELTQALMILRNDFNGTVEHLSQVQSDKDHLLNELNCVQAQMNSLCHKNEELQHNHQLSLKSCADERFQFSSQLETLSEIKKHLELEVLKCHDIIKRKKTEFETMSIQVKDLKQSAVLVEKLKERCRLLETNSAKESENLRQKLDEERRWVEMERHRQQAMQQDYRYNSDRLQMQLDTKTRELNEANDRIQSMQKTHDQYRDQLTEMSHRHQEEMTELKRTLEEKSQQHDDVTVIAEEAKRWREMYEDLWNKVQPFKSQLEAYEMEKQLLLGHSKNAQKEIEKLSHDYAKILGHQNHKQKIHHLLKLKEENIALKKDVEMLRDKDCKQKRQIGQLTEKLDALEGKRRFEPSKAFKPSRESDVPNMLPLREGNR